MKSSNLSLAAAIILTSAMSAMPVFAQEETDAAADQLRETETLLRSTQSAAERLEVEAEMLAEEQAELDQKLIDSAAQIQANEAQITQGEERLLELGAQEADLRVDLSEQRSNLSGVLAALQRLERSPPPVLAVRPDDAVSAVRSAMLLSNVIPHIRVRTDALAGSLIKLARLQEDIGREQEELALNIKNLEQQRGVIARLLEVKKEFASKTIEERDAARRRAEALAEEAGSLRELLAKLEDERLKRESELTLLRGPVDEVSPGVEPQPDTPEQAIDPRLAMASPDRLKTKLAFAKAKGQLVTPASGKVTLGFGAKDEYGSKSQGILVRTRSQAQVTSPAEGWVVFAGAFPGYGQLTIIDAGDGYHIVLGGLARIDVAPGQLVLAGEPLGVMPEEDKDQSPDLYIEFRKGDRSIDPAPWWKTPQQLARG